MEKEFNLSEKINEKSFMSNLEVDSSIRTSDVKEFIRLLLKQCDDLEESDCFAMSNVIRDLAGEKLI